MLAALLDRASPHGITIKEPWVTIATAVPFDSATFRRVLGHYPTGVCVVTAVESDSTPVAMVVGSFTSVSLDPPLVAFFPDRSSTTWPKIERAGRFCVNVLGSHQQDLCRRLSAKTGDKYDGVIHTFSPTGAPLLDDVIAWVDCTLELVYEAGDHFIVLGRVVELGVNNPRQPLLFYRGSYGGFAPLD